MIALAVVLGVGGVFGAEAWLNREPARVDVAPPPVGEPDVARACTALIEALPAATDGARRRLVAPLGTSVAAYGQPPITVRCGVPRPADAEPTDQAVEVDGVAWFLAEAPDGYRFTTVGRVAYLEVAVPKHYAPEVDVLLDLAPAIQDTLPLVGPTATD